MTSVTLSLSHHNHDLKWIQLILTHALFRNLLLTTRSLTASWWASPVREPTRSGRNPGPARLSRHWGYTNILYSLPFFAMISPTLLASFLFIFMMFVCFFLILLNSHLPCMFTFLCLILAFWKASYIYQFLANCNDKLCFVIVTIW